MTLDNYLATPYAAVPIHTDAGAAAAAPAGDGALERLLHQKSEILERKLEILAAEIRWRLRVAAGNIAAVDENRATVLEMLARLDRAANYQRRKHEEKAAFYRRLFELDSEGRAEQVECWRDVVLVMREMLVAWEAHEQAQARAIFLDDVGSGPQGAL
jgi:hypothetical protein